MIVYFFLVCMLQRTTPRLYWIVAGMEIMRLSKLTDFPFSTPTTFIVKQILTCPIVTFTLPSNLTSP